jgi:hypothetical protein
MTDELARQLQKQDGLAPGGAPDAMLELLRNLQAKADARERFWFRMACAFWIVSGLSFVVAAVALLGSAGTTETRESRALVAVAEPPDKEGRVPPKPVKLEERVDVETTFRFEPVIATFFVAASILAVLLVGGLFSSVWLMLTRRQASQAAMNFTLAALTNEIRTSAQKSASS